LEYVDPFIIKLAAQLNTWDIRSKFLPLNEIPERQTTMDTETLKRSLPRNLENRFASLASYVNSILEVERQGNKRFPRLTEQQITLIQLLVFVYTLDSFMRTGTLAARTASNIFNQFDIDSFRIGSKSFTANNENTLLGEMLANSLQESIGQAELEEIMKSSKSIRELILSIVRRLANGESLD
jgi:hypothetical protein